MKVFLYLYQIIKKEYMRKNALSNKTYCNV